MKDVIIIGTGPAGVSAAYPLAEAGLDVLLLDAGGEPASKPPLGNYLDLRRGQADQADWIIGKDFHALRELSATSPKFRAPTLKYVFEGFEEANQIKTDGFVAIGSLATGGLSNAWGCGVARFDETDLRDFPFPADELMDSYEKVARRVGVSGGDQDDLSDYFGLGRWSDPPVTLDEKHAWLWNRYLARKEKVASLGVRIGRPPLAMLSVSRDGRDACQSTGLCLWGCAHRSLYSSRYDLEDLVQRDNVAFMSHMIVQSLHREGQHFVVAGVHRNNKDDTFSLSARKVVVAAGAIATTRLVFHALKWYEHPVRLLSNPMAAFLLFLPSRLREVRPQGHALGQLSFVSEGPLNAKEFAGGALFSTLGLPVTEFLRHLPMCRRYGVDLLRTLLPATLVGNCLFPGSLSRHEATLQLDGRLCIRGGYDSALHHWVEFVRNRLGKAFRRMGAFIFPGGFIVGAPGADVHYAGTVPMKTHPAPNESTRYGEVAGLPGVYVVDGAALPRLPAKAHTLTIMANADRIGTRLVEKFASKSPKV